MILASKRDRGHKALKKILQKPASSNKEDRQPCITSGLAEIFTISNPDPDGKSTCTNLPLNCIWCLSTRKICICLDLVRNALNPSFPEDLDTTLANTALAIWPQAGAHCRKLDGVGPVDNRPSTDKLHHFVQKKKRKCDM